MRALSLFSLITLNKAFTVIVRVGLVMHTPFLRTGDNRLRVLITIHALNSCFESLEAFNNFVEAYEALVEECVD